MHVWGRPVLKLQDRCGDSPPVHWIKYPFRCGHCACICTISYRSGRPTALWVGNILQVWHPKVWKEYMDASHDVPPGSRVSAERFTEAAHTDLDSFDRRKSSKRNIFNFFHMFSVQLFNIFKRAHPQQTSLSVVHLLKNIRDA